MNIKRQWQINHPGSVLTASYLGLLFPFLTIFGFFSVHDGLENVPNRSGAGYLFQSAVVTPTTVPVNAAPVSITSTVSTTGTDFTISLAELGYEEKTLRSPFGIVEYDLRLPEGWQLRDGSFFDLDFSYLFSPLNTSENPVQLPLLGNLIVTVDGETQLIFPIKEPQLDHSRLRITLPSSLLNDPARDVHRITVALDAGFICAIPHQAYVVVHSTTSFFSLAYTQLPITVDLAVYPRPFYQQAFEPDHARFILPTHPVESEMTGALAVAAKLGRLTRNNLVISGTTDLAVLDRLKTGESSREHLIIIGRPERNQMILQLNQLGVLPIPLQQRQLSLASEGPTTVSPGSNLTYTLTLTNTSPDDLSSLKLVDTLPAYAQVTHCNPTCSKIVAGEVSWPVAKLAAGESFSYTFQLHLSDVITSEIFVLENIVTLLDANSQPINVNTLTATVTSTSPPVSVQRSVVSTGDGYFFYQAARAVSEGDGIVQEIVSPWDQTRAILIITGLSDEAIYKASRAMSSANRFPGMQGAFALVRDVRSMVESSPESQLVDQVTLADLGYEDRILEENTLTQVNYFFNLPITWRLGEEAYFDLQFSHSQIINYKGSSLNVALNDQPIASIPLSDENAEQGRLKVKLPSSRTYPGRGNKISIQAELQSEDKCADLGWLLIDSQSVLSLAHKEQANSGLNLDLYPYPFDRQPGLANILFTLPAEPQFQEWEASLRLAAALANDAGGSDFAPAVAVGDTWSNVNLTNYHLLAIGRPSRLPLLRHVNTQLPQPFLPDSDVIEPNLNQEILRLPPERSLGIIQLLTSPWNEAHALLVVTGTTDEGLQWANDVLIHRPWNLKGNLSFITADTINTIDTRELTKSGQAKAVATAVAEVSPVLVVTATLTPVPSPSPLPEPASTPAAAATSTSPQNATPAWLMPLVGLTGLAIVVIFGVAFWQSRRHS